jgi:hypothetical protein
MPQPKPLTPEEEAERKTEQDLRERATESFLEQTLGWDKPGEEGMQAMFESLKVAAGPRGATFLGRPITKDDTLEDVLKRIPAAELEEAGGTIKAIKSPESIGVRPYGAMTPVDMAVRVFGIDPFVFQPAGLVKYMRRKLQGYVDPDGEGPIKPRPAPKEAKSMVDIADLLGKMMRENFKDSDK